MIFRHCILSSPRLLVVQHTSTLIHLKNSIHTSQYITSLLSFWIWIWLVARSLDSILTFGQTAPAWKSGGQQRTDWGEDSGLQLRWFVLRGAERWSLVILSYVECTATGSSGLRRTGCNKQRAGRKGEGAVNMKYLDLYNKFHRQGS